jgi:hypothetical protein
VAWLRRAIVVVLAPILAGCFVTHHIPLNAGAELGNATGVTTRAGTEIDFATTGATITNDTLHAVGRHDVIALPADSVARISVRKFSPRSTAALAVGVGAVAFVALLFISIGRLGTIE